MFGTWVRFVFFNSAELNPSWLDSVFVGAEEEEEEMWLMKEWETEGMKTRRRRCSTYLEPADVKSPHRSEPGWATGTGEPKSRRGAEHGEEENPIYNP